MILKQARVYTIIMLILWGCNEKYTPKPRGFFRIDFPEKGYKALTEEMPYRFEIPVYAELVPDADKLAEPFWVNIEIPKNKAEIHISYKKIDPSFDRDSGKRSKNPEEAKRSVLNKYMEESRTLAYKHTIKADAIEERIFINPGAKVYGTIYMIEGNAASPIQFYLTDSVQHFLRGALYIREIPNIDSIRPVIQFLEPDVIHLIETTTWN